MVRLVLIYDLYRGEKRKVRGQGEGCIIFIVLLQGAGGGDMMFILF